MNKEFEMLDYGSLSDFELTDLLKEGDAAAYTVIYNRYFEELFIHAANRLNDKERHRMSYTSFLSLYGIKDRACLLNLIWQLTCILQCATGFLMS